MHFTCNKYDGKIRFPKERYEQLNIYNNIIYSYLECEYLTIIKKEKSIGFYNILI